MSGQPGAGVETRGEVRKPRSSTAWGSDAIAEQLRALDLPYVCINPGASFRGLHDSLVNYLGNERPHMLLCLHEEHAVAIAHGYAKVAGKPLAVIVHSNVGLMHASMAIFNAWCDRVPVIVLGATGPVDAAKRRPWIDWIHTARDQGGLVRDFIKWDDQPASVAAALESLLRANQIAQASPKGPVYVCFDAELQEQQLDRMPVLAEAARYGPPLSPYPPPQLVAQAAEWLGAASNPVFLVGRVNRDRAAWTERIALAESLGATVLTDLKVGAAFPTAHPLHAAAPSFFLTPEAAQILRRADVVVSFDWVDLAGTFKQAWGRDAVGARVIQVSLDQFNHNGWSMDHQALPPIDLYLQCEPETAVSLLLQTGVSRPAPAVGTFRATSAVAKRSEGGISMAQLASQLRAALHGREVCLARLPLGWNGELWDFSHPLDYLGYDGGGGIGSGPGMAVGAALALKGTGRLPIAILGDGDFMMGVTALWTAANNAIPVLVIVANNRSFFNDEVHQERIAMQRGRPVENRWIGQRIGDPDPDLAMIARGQGLEGIGPIVVPEDLPAALASAIQHVSAGRSVVVDVRVPPSYSPSMSAGMTRSSGE